MEISSQGKLRFKSTGYLVIENFISVAVVDEIKSGVQAVTLSDGVTMFSDRQGLPRRLERFTYKDARLIGLMEDVGECVKAVTEEEQVLFKDKVNFKPPGGEGFNAHYDGIFEYKSLTRKVGRGWFDYADRFTNGLITLDPFTQHNGALEIADRHLGDFDELLNNTNKDGSPDLRHEVALDCEFKPIFCGPGTLIIFDSACPHRSGKNRSMDHRSTIYWTYHNAIFGRNYDRYFEDKDASINKNKALLGEE